MLLIVQKSVKTVPKEEGEEEEEEEEGEYDGPRAPLQTGATTESAADPLHIASCSPYTPRIYTYFLEGNPPSFFLFPPSIPLTCIGVIREEH